MSEVVDGAGVAASPTPDATGTNPVPDVQEPAAGQEPTAQVTDTGDNLGLVNDGESDGKDKAEDSADVEFNFDGLKCPEEWAEIDKPTAEAFGAIAKKLGLNQEGFNTMFNDIITFANERQNERLNEVRLDFYQTAKADSEIGGAKWKESLGLARKALFQFTDAPTRELLQASGLDCHPGIIKAFRNIALAMSDDNVHRGTQATGERDVAKSFFYNSDMK